MKKSIIISAVLFILQTAVSFSQLAFTFPRKNDKLVAGTDTLITWQGTLPSDTVRLEYSCDNGLSWNLIVDNPANDYINTSVPNKNNSELLLRIIKKSEIWYDENKPYIEWSKTYGGSRNDGLKYIFETSDGGFVSFGGTASEIDMSDSNNYDFPYYNDTKDFWQVKTDDHGNLLKSEIFGCSKNDFLYNVIQIDKDTLLIAGIPRTLDCDFENQVHYKFIRKCNSDLEMIWQTSVYGYEDIFDITVNYDNSISVITDTTLVRYFAPNAPYTVAKVFDLNHKGEIVRTLLPHKKYPYYFNSIKSTYEGNYITTGIKEVAYGDIYDIDNDTSHIFISLLDRNYNTIWEIIPNKKLVFHAPQYKSLMNNLSSILQTKDSNFIALGSSTFDENTNELSAKVNIWCLMISKEGEIIWEKFFGGTEADYLGLRTHPIILDDDGFIFVSVTRSKDGDISGNNGGNDAWLVKVDYDGNLIWEMNFGGRGSDSFTSVKKTSDKGYILCGSSSSSDGDVPENKGKSDGWILKLATKYQDIDTVIVPVQIIKPIVESQDIDMGQEFLGKYKDSTITTYLRNVGECRCRIDSIYIQGKDKDAFVFLGDYPKYNIEQGESHAAAFRFSPLFARHHEAEVVIITQIDTLIQKIIGEGIRKYPKITAIAKGFPNIICEQMATSEIEIQNTGGDTLTITEINLIGTNADEFTISPNLPMVLDTTEIFMLPIQFKPKSIGSKTAQIEIKSNEIINPEFVDITATKDSVLLVPEPINISLGKLFQSQPKDTSIKIINTGSMETVGFATLSENLTALETAFYVNENETHVFNFTFTGLENETLFNEMISIYDTICQNEKEVIISGEITEPTITGFTGKQCVKEEHKYTINLTNPSDNNLNITSIYFDNSGGKYGFDNTLLPINISANTDIPITFSSDEIGIFETKITCQTDNEFIPELSVRASIEAVKFTRSHSSYIENKIHTLANPYPVTYDTTSDYGTRNFIYSIRMHQLDDYFSELISPDTLEIKIDFESNFIAPLITTLELGEQMNSYQVIERKEVEIDPMNARLIIKLAKSESSEIIPNDYELLHIEFTTFLSRNGVGENAIAEIRHEIKSDYFCLDYETDMTSAVILENQCIDDIYIIKPGKDFYFSEIKPNPIDRNEIEIEYGIAFDCHVSIKIYDTAGKLILTPIDAFQTQGEFQKSLSVEDLQAGTYFIELEASSFKQTRRIVVE